MKKKKQLSRIALLAEDRHLSATGEAAVEEADRLKQDLARRRQQNEISVILDAVAREDERVCLWFTGRHSGISGKIRRTAKGYFWLRPASTRVSLQSRVIAGRMVGKPIPEGEIYMIQSDGGQVLWQRN